MFDSSNPPPNRGRRSCIPDDETLEAELEVVRGILAHDFDDVHLAISRFVGDVSGYRGCDASALSKGLGGLLAQRLDDELSAPDASLVDAQAPGGSASHRRVGVTPQALQEDWEERVETDEYGATLPVLWCAYFVLPRFWPAVGWLLRQDKKAYTGRMRRLVKQLERTPVSNRPAGADDPIRGEYAEHARDTIESRQNAVRRLLRKVGKLASDGHPSPLFARWKDMPSAVPVKRNPPKRNRSAPSRANLRTARAGVLENIANVLGCSPDDDLLPAVQALPRYRFQQGTQAFRHFGDLMALDILTISAGRLAATWWLNADFIVDNYVCFDGIEMPAILMRPGKNLPLRLRRPKVIPVPMYREIRAARVYMERAAEIGRGVVLPPDGPLLLGDLTAGRRLSEDAYRDRINRLLGFSVSGRQQSPHRVRRAAVQLAKAGALPHIERHERDLPAKVVALALADHDIPRDTTNYEDYNSEEGRERLSRIATFGMWRLLTTDAGADLTPDRAALEEAWRRRAFLAAELELVREHVDLAVPR